MARMSEVLPEPPAVRSPRARGLLVMAVLVLLGVGVTAGYLAWKAPEVGKIISDRKRAVAEAPRTPEGRLGNWLVFGAPQIHHRLEIMRFSAEQPWLVTHAVRLPGDDPERLEIHGIDLSRMPRDVARVDGTVVRVKLPLPTLLGTGPLKGINASAVPVVAEASAAPDPIARTEYLVRFALDGLAQALGRDIPGATLSIEIGPEASFEAIAEAAR
jgi:hypothetical protein